MQPGSATFALSVYNVLNIYIYIHMFSLRINVFVYVIYIYPIYLFPSIGICIPTGMHLQTSILGTFPFSLGTL